MIGFLGGFVIGFAVMQYTFWGIGIPRWGWGNRAFLKSISLSIFAVLCAGVAFALFMIAITPLVLGSA